MQQSKTINQERNPLATAPIGRLVARFAIPCVISLLVNSLYNIVDQIFIGWGVGYLGNGATNVVFPITIIALALALLFGDGGASYLSLKLGEGKKEQAAKGVGNAVTMAAISGILCLVLGLLFLSPLVRLFGATDIIYPYAMTYGRIIVIGLPFTVFGTALNSMIRADGSPKFAMVSMLLGALINTILDPVFIFVFKMGVAGAAWATILGQLSTFIMAIWYLRKFKSVDLKMSDFIPTWAVSGLVAAYGVSSFITQLAITVVMAVINNMLTIYGAYSAYGSEIPLTAVGIVMKVNQIMISICVGIAAGTQPIIGYNYGAGNEKRVKETLYRAVIYATIVTLVAFLCFQLFPLAIVRMFGSEEGLYNEFAQKAFRIFLLFCIFNGFQTVVGIFLQALGKPVKSAIVSLSRQIIFLVPAAVILPRFYGVEGVLWAGPAADGLAFLLSLVILVYEVRILSARQAVKTLGLEKRAESYV